MRLPENNLGCGKWWRRLSPHGGWILSLLALLALRSPSFAGAEISVTDPPPAKLETEAVPDVLRSYLQLQEQLHAAQLAIERNRQEAETAAAHNADVIATRLQALETTLATQRSREIETMRDTNRLMITLGGACAGVGFLAMLLTAYFQWRAVSRLTEFSVLSQASLTIGRTALPAPGSPDSSPVSGVASEQGNARLLSALERLEGRVAELEHTAHGPLSENNAPASEGKQDRIAVLLAKGESLLSLDKTEEALACYDEILALSPEHSEALVKKGDALERLRKVDDAIQCYDRAIAADGSLTVAYLHKGGLFNRLERYEEALQCYEQALRTQEKSHAA